MSLTARTLLFLSADHFQAYTWSGGKLTDAQYFNNDADGREHFSAFLHENRAPAYLLVDVIEEDFRHELVPHLIGPGRSELINRKFEQYYRNTPFRQAKVIQRQSEGRRDDDMLFSALTNPQRITPWLETLLAGSTPLIAIQSVPNISAPLLKDIDDDHVLLLSWEKHAGLRQTYFNNKRLHFSRLIPVSGNNSFADSVAAETPRTQQYLKSLSLPPAGEQLHVYVVCHADDRRELENHLGGNGDLRYAFLDIQELGKRIKSKDSYPDSDATPLFLHLLAHKPPAHSYANREHTHFFLLWQLRWIFFGLAVVITLFSLIWSGLSIWQGQQYADETEPLLAQAARTNRQSEDVRRSFPPTTVPASDMKTAVLLARSLNNYAPPPEMILQGLGAVLDRFTRIRPAKIAWQTSAADAPPPTTRRK